MQQVARSRPGGRREDLRAVTLADGRRFLLEAEQVTFLGLSPETAVDVGLERRLVNLDERIRAREAALTLLRYRLRRRAELTARLRRRGVVGGGGGAAAAPRLFRQRDRAPPAPLHAAGAPGRPLREYLRVI